MHQRVTNGDLGNEHKLVRLPAANYYAYISGYIERAEQDAEIVKKAQKHGGQ